MSVFADLAQYRGAVPFEHWVARVAVTTCFDALQREKARPELRWADLSAAETAALEEILSRNESPSEARDAAADETLLKLLDTLPPRDCALMHWLNIEEESAVQVAERLGWSRTRVNVTAFRIRLRLRATVRKLMKEGRL